MGFARWKILAAVALSSVFAPLGIVAWLMAAPMRSQADLVAGASACVVWVAFLVLANWWEFTSIYLRWVWSSLVLAAATLRLAEWTAWPAWRGVTWQLATAAVVTAGGVWAVALATGGRRYDPSHALELEFPLAAGRFLITDGGDGRRAPFTNYHFGFGAHRASGVGDSMRFATDIVEIGPLGGASSGFLPRRNDAYRIWEKPVLAPLSGEVVHVVDDVADNTAFGSFRPYGVGNHVVIRGDGDVYVVVGHLREGSVACSVGQRVSAGEAIGRVGNSGWTERPHVHVQAMRSAEGDWWHGEPLPMTFSGRLLVRNVTLRA